MTMTPRFVYATYRTRDAAELALESMFAEGLVCEGERPSIEKRRGRYAITLQC
jgi:hypothetical protein